MCVGGWLFQTVRFYLKRKEGKECTNGRMKKKRSNVVKNSIFSLMEFHQNLDRLYFLTFNEPMFIVLFSSFSLPFPCSLSMMWIHLYFSDELIERILCFTNCLLLRKFYIFFKGIFFYTEISFRYVQKQHLCIKSSFQSISLRSKISWSFFCSCSEWKARK